MSPDNQKFPPHFREFIQALNNNDVEYMLIGGYAMGAYGHIRATSDLDIFINATENNADRLVQACIEYGIEQESLQKKMFLVPKMIGIGQPPLRIEILKHLDVIDFDLAYQRVMKREVDGVEIKVISLEDLTALKKAAIIDRGASRDSEDLDYLNKLNQLIKKKGKIF